MLQAMKENGWDQKRLEAHLSFWMALGAHEWRHDSEDTAKRTLIVYQATVQKRWHDTLGIPHSFNLKYVNEALLNKIQMELMHKAHDWAVKQANEVHTSKYCIPTTMAFTHETPYIIQIVHATLHTYPSWLHATLPLGRTHYTADPVRGTGVHNMARDMAITPSHLPLP